MSAKSMYFGQGGCHTTPKTNHSIDVRGLFLASACQMLSAPHTRAHTCGRLLILPPRGLSHTSPGCLLSALQSDLSRLLIKPSADSTLPLASDSTATQHQDACPASRSPLNTPYTLSTFGWGYRTRASLPDSRSLVFSTRVQHHRCLSSRHCLPPAACCLLWLSVSPALTAGCPAPASPPRRRPCCCARTRP